MVEWLAGNRIIGTTAERPNFGLPSGSVGGWVEVGRTTLGSAGSTITVSSLADKRYYMVLVNSIATGATPQGALRLGNTTAATSSYSGRYSRNGAADATNLNAASMTFEGYSGGTTPNVLGTAYISNLSSKEKLLITNTVRAGATGAATAPDRQENATKWAYTSNPLDLVQLYNTNTSTFASGSEIVVLGWDPADSHTTNFWEELSSTSLSGSAGFLNSSQFTAKKYIWFQAYLKNSGSIQLEMKFGHGGTITTGTDYASRLSINGGTDNTLRVSKNSIQTEHPTSSPIFVNGFIVNNASNEKLCIMHEVIQNTATAGYAPERVEFVGKWADTTNQIDIIQMTDSGSGSFADGSTLKVWGSD